MMFGFIFLMKLRAVWEMLIQSSVRSGRNYEAEASFPLTRNTKCCHFYHIKIKQYIKDDIYQRIGQGTWKAVNFDENRRKVYELGNKWLPGP